MELRPAIAPLLVVGTESHPFRIGRHCGFLLEVVEGGLQIGLMRGDAAVLTSIEHKALGFVGEPLVRRVVSKFCLVFLLGEDGFPSPLVFLNPVRAGFHIVERAVLRVDTHKLVVLQHSLVTFYVECHEHVRIVGRETCHIKLIPGDGCLHLILRHIAQIGRVGHHIAFHLQILGQCLRSLVERIEGAVDVAVAGPYKVVALHGTHHHLVIERGDGTVVLYLQHDFVHIPVDVVGRIGILVALPVGAGGLYFVQCEEHIGVKHIVIPQLAGYLSGLYLDDAVVYSALHPGAAVAHVGHNVFEVVAAVGALHHIGAFLCIVGRGGRSVYRQIVRTRAAHQHQFALWLIEDGFLPVYHIAHGSFGRKVFLRQFQVAGIFHHALLEIGMLLHIIYVAIRPLCVGNGCHK